MHGTLTLSDLLAKRAFHYKRLSSSLPAPCKWLFLRTLSSVRPFQTFIPTTYFFIAKCVYVSVCMYRRFCWFLTQSVLFVRLSIFLCVFSALSSGRQIEPCDIEVLPNKTEILLLFMAVLWIHSVEILWYRKSTENYRKVVQAWIHRVHTYC